MSGVNRSIIAAFINPGAFKPYSFVFSIALLLLSFTASSQSIVSSFDSTVRYPHLQIERSMIYSPVHEYMYSHHPYITSFNGRFIATWSNGMKDEDDPGQRVSISYSDDFIHWTSPISLAEPGTDSNGIPEILTAAGFYTNQQGLVAYYGSYTKNRTSTRLYARTSTDGIIWGKTIDLNLPVIPNHAPALLKNGRLLICGNFTFPFSDDNSGLSGWTQSGFYPQELGNVSDNPWSFWKISKAIELPVSLCEGSFYQTEDNIIHMFLRSAGITFAGYLWLTESADNGISWSRPVATTFPDNDHKFHFGRLNDGRYYYVGCPVSFPRERRSPLVLSISTDGKLFDRHFIIADSPYSRRSEGRYKAGQYGYPSTFEKDGYLYIIVSRQKEGIEAMRVNLAECK
ncbi:MAG: exo-alpha-sialidase [Bacteroidales bacterium]|nr:exo-alpha-sialidase [Bacteroidales bacterium]